MIKKSKAKFARSAELSDEIELGARQGLFHDNRDGTITGNSGSKKDRKAQDARQGLPNNDPADGETPPKNKTWFEQRAESFIKGAGSQKVIDQNIAREDIVQKYSDQDTRKEIAQKQYDQEKYKADKGLEQQKETNAAHISIPENQARAQVLAARIQTDHEGLDQNEVKIVQLTKKYNLANGIEELNQKIAAGDKDAIKDALTLEKALQKDGKSLTVDGKITEKTYEALLSTLSENSKAILELEKVKASLTPENKEFKEILEKLNKGMDDKSPQRGENSIEQEQQQKKLPVREV